MKFQKQQLSGTEEVDGVTYSYLVSFGREFPPGPQPKFWGVGDIVSKEFTPPADERTTEEILHRVLERVNTDTNARPPIEAVSDALRRLVQVAAQMGSVDLAIKIGSDWDDLQGMYERGRQTLMDSAIALYEALQPLGETASRYALELHATSPEGNQEAQCVCFLPNALPPPPPASRRN